MQRVNDATSSFGDVSQTSFARIEGMSDRNSADISQSYSGLGRLASKFDNSPSKLTAGLHEDDY